MAYRNGTYVAFHADGNNIPGGKSDIDYYNLMKAWAAHKNNDFTMVNSHEKTYAVRDSSSRETLRRSLLERLRNSKNMVLILGKTTHMDTDWVPFEISKAVDDYGLPIIATYPHMAVPIRNPAALNLFWPQALAERIANGKASVIHIPFNKNTLLNAIGQFDHGNLPLPLGGLGFYSDEAYRQFGLG